MMGCPYCNSPVVEDPPYRLLNLKQCLECGLVFKPEQVRCHLKAHSDLDEHFQVHSGDQISGKREAVYEHILDIMSVANPGRLLDVGTGCGFFLSAACRRGWKAIGIDPSPKSVQYARDNNHAEIFQGTLTDIENEEKFDAITFINVLDHLDEPWRDVEKAASLLNKGGKIYIRFPNSRFHTTLFLLLNKLRLADLVPRIVVFHNYSFTSRYIRTLLSDKGFTDIRIGPSQLSTPRIPLFCRKGIVSKMTCALWDFAQNTFLGKLIFRSTLEAVAVK